MAGLEKEEEAREQRHKTVVEKCERHVCHFLILHQWDVSQRSLDSVHQVYEERDNLFFILEGE